jgi:hypothetical protein
MRYAVIETGVFPPAVAAWTDTEESAKACLAHLGAMFPHLRGNGWLHAVPADDWRAVEGTPATGALRDCVTAYIATGNGAPRPAPGSVQRA